MKGYYVLTLSDNSQKLLLEKFGQKYKKLICHHITIAFGIDETEIINYFDDSEIVVKVIDYVDSNDGIETFVVSVNNTTKRHDNKVYHITHSLDPLWYKPVDSNSLLKNKEWNYSYDILIDVKPEFIYFN